MTKEFEHLNEVMNILEGAKLIDTNSKPVKGDEVNHPAHYAEGKRLGFETITVLKNELTKEAFEGFLLGNTIKYLSRAGKKGDPVVDLRKAAWYLDALIKEQFDA